MSADGLRSPSDHSMSASDGVSRSRSPASTSRVQLPGSVAKLCWSFIEPTPKRDPVDLGKRWRYLVGAYGLKTPDDVVATVLAQTEACAEDIEREAARQSVRHQALANRGDHLALRTMHSWAVANEHALRMGFGASGRVT
jgi:hypothetical protein